MGRKKNSKELGTADHMYFSKLAAKEALIPPRDAKSKWISKSRHFLFLHPPECRKRTAS